MIRHRTRVSAAAGAALSVMLVSACSTGGDSSPESITDSAPTDLDVAVATNEPWGTYHLDDVLPAAQDRDMDLTLVIPDEVPADDALDEDSPVPTLPLSQAQDEDFDLLVVNGATEWPGELARALDELPAWQPRERTVAVLTGVTHPDETGAAAPGGELLLNIAEQLDSQGWDVTVGLHPREDPQLWDDYVIDEEGSVHAATTASAVVGIPGSIFPEIAALGVPLVGVEDDGLDVPDYLTDLAVGVSDAAEGVEAVDEAAAEGAPHDAEAVDAATVPVGGAAGRLVDAWEAGAEQPQS